MKRKRHRYRWLLYVGAFLLVLLVIARALLPFWVRDYVNRKLSEMPDYRGHVAGVTLHLWRGAYQLHNVDIEKTTGHVPVPFFSAPLTIFPCNGRRSSMARSSANSIFTNRR